MNGAKTFNNRHVNRRIGGLEMHHVVGLAEAIVNRRISGLEILLVFLLLTVVVNRRIGGLEISVATEYTGKMLTAA